MDGAAWPANTGLRERDAQRALAGGKTRQGPFPRYPGLAGPGLGLGLAALVVLVPVPAVLHDLGPLLFGHGLPIGRVLEQGHVRPAGPGSTSVSPAGAGGPGGIPRRAISRSAAPAAARTGIVCSSQARRASAAGRSPSRRAWETPARNSRTWPLASPRARAACASAWYIVTASSAFRRSSRTSAGAVASARAAAAWRA